MQDVDRWFSAHYSLMGDFGSDLVAVVFDDITERKRAEQVLRESEERQAFLLRLSDALRAESDDASVEDCAVHMLAEQLGLDLCYAASFDLTEDLAVITHQALRGMTPPMPATLRLSDFPDAFRQVLNRALVFDDIVHASELPEVDRRNIAALGVGALLSVPIRRGPMNPVWAITAVARAPRHWTASDVALVEDVAERTWGAIERARGEAALRKSEATLAGQREALELALKGGPLEQSLSVLGQTAVSLFDHDARFAFYLANAEGTALRHIVGMPDDHAAEVEGFKIGPDSLACGLATHTGHPVLTTDVREDPNWTPWRDMAARHDYRGCWSFPINSSRGTYVGTFALYWREPREATDDDVRLAALITQSAAIIIARDIDARHLRESEERFQQFATASAAGLWIRDAASLEMEFVSPAIATIYGIETDALLGDVKHWASMIVPEDRDLALRHLEAARQGEVAFHEFRIQRPSDQAFRWIRSTDFPLRDNGHILRIGGIAEDVTEAKLVAEHQGVLLAELQHRVRNIMAIVRSITARTSERARTVQDYLDSLMGRLLALTRVQTLLTRAANVSVGIGGLVHDEVSVQAQHERQYVLDGPDVKLSPKAAEVLTLAIHELATNALKYGALSTPNGKITVRWQTFDRRGTTWLGLDWMEEGAPEPAQAPAGNPRRRGFGSELIEGRIPYELGGRGSISIELGGARCHLEFPLEEGASILETGAPQRATVFGGALDMTGEADLSAVRVLVVEDQYYLATDAARALQGAGAEVVGPFPTEEAARLEIENQRPDAVLLDVDLGHGASFELAGHLRESGIPFLFVTGYGADVIPAEFDGIERLEKPIQLRQIIGAISRLLTPTVQSPQE